MIEVIKPRHESLLGYLSVYRCGPYQMVVLEEYTGENSASVVNKWNMNYPEISYDFDKKCRILMNLGMINWDDKYIVDIIYDSLKCAEEMETFLHENNI